MKEKLREKSKIIIVFAALFAIMAILLLLIFNAGKKTYTVKFVLDGGTLEAGFLEQIVIKGEDAVPPKVSKEGYYLASWSKSYQRVKEDLVIEAVWARPVSAGINYADGSNYSTIHKAYSYIQGEITLSSYNGSNVILGINDGAFENIKGITGITLPEMILSIGARAFSGCTGLTEITIPDEVVHIGDSAFYGCELLEKAVLNEALAAINASTFEGCVALTEIEIPSSVTYIGTNAFYGCESLEALILNEGVEKIESGAFAGCTSLKTVILPESLTTIAADAFAGCEDLVIVTYCEQDEAPEGWAEGWSGNATVEWGGAAEEESTS